MRIENITTSVYTNLNIHWHIRSKTLCFKHTSNHNSSSQHINILAPKDIKQKWRAGFFLSAIL